MPNISAQDYLAQLKARNEPGTLRGLAKSLVFAHMGEVQFRLGESLGIGFKPDKPWADLPTPMATPSSGTTGRMVRYGTQPMVFVPGLENIAGPTEAQAKLRLTTGSIMDPWGNLKDIITSTLRPGIDADHTGLVLRPEIRKWSTLHLQDLNAAGGQLNAGMIGAASRRRKIFFNDSGYRARILGDNARNFMSAVLGNEEHTRPDSLTNAFHTYRRGYIDELATVLRQVSPETGAHLNLHGIKHASFEDVSRFKGGNWIRDTSLLVNTGSASAHQLFGNIGDMQAGDQHISQYVSIPFVDKPDFFSKGMMHPLVGGSSYEDDLRLISEGSRRKLGTFGTQVRADVGYLYGPMAELFSSRAFGDAGAMVTSQRMLNTTSLTSAPYTLKVLGPKGMAGLPSPVADLSAEIMAIPGVVDFLGSRESNVITFPEPIALNNQVVAQFASGKKIKGIKGFSSGDKILSIQKQAAGIKLFMERSKPVFKTGRPVMINGVRHTLGVGPSVRGFDIITHGSKHGDPRVVREQWASHYADKVFGAKGLTNRQRVQALTAFGEFSGIKTGTYGNGNVFLHGDLESSSRFAGTEFMDDTFREGLAEHLNKKLGVSVFSNKSLAPKSRNVSKKMQMAFLTTSGRMSDSDAASFMKYSSDLTKTTKLSIFKLSGQNVKFRATDVGATKGRIRMLDAKNLMAKLSSYQGADADIARKMGSLIGGNVSSIENYVKLAQAAQAAPLMGNDVVARVTEAAAGKIKTFKFGDIANRGLLDDLERSLKDTGTLSPELAERFTKHFGMENDTIGAFIDLRGTQLQGLDLFSGARNFGSSADAVTAPADFAFLHNIRRVIPDINRKSMTGNMGDMAVIPRRAVAQGIDANKRGALGVIPNTFNAYLEMLNPFATRGAMQDRLWLHNTAAREWMTGSKGIIGKKSMRGFIAGRFTGQTLGTAEHDLAIGLTESGIKRTFGSKVGTTGHRMLEDLKAGKQVFTFYKRDPVQSSQQLLPVRLQLVTRNDIRLRKMIKGRQMEAETMWVSRLVAAASNADFDSDQMVAFLMNQGKDRSTLPYEEQQRVVGSMYREELDRALPLGQMIDQGMYNNDSYSRRLIAETRGKLSPKQVAQSMAGKKWENVVNPNKVIDDLLGEIGYKGPYDEALRGAAAAFQRQIAGGGGVGIMHSFAMKQAGMFDVVGNAAGNYYNMPHADILAKASELGIGNIRHSQNADYLRVIYGFLKKGTQSTEATLRGITALKMGTQLPTDSAEYRALTADLANSLIKMSEGVSGMGNAFYTFAKEGQLDAARVAAASKMDSLAGNKAFYEGLASEAMAVAKLQKFASQHGYRGTKRMGTGREPGSFLRQIFSEVLGGAPVNMPATSPSGAVLNAAMGDRGYINGSSMGGKVANQVAEAAAAGVGDALNKAGTLAQDFGGTKGWGNMKIAAAAAGGLAVISMFSNKKREEPPAPIVEDGSSYGAPMPPAPQIGFPNDGARPSALAPQVNTARINRVPGQRRHFGGEDKVFMPAPYDIMGDFHGSSLGGSMLGEMPTMMPTMDDFEG